MFESATVDYAEDGIRLILTDEDGSRVGLRITQEAAEELDASLAGVREHAHEREQAYAEYRAGLHEPFDGRHEAAREAADLSNKARKENP